MTDPQWLALEHLKLLAELFSCFLVLVGWFAKWGKHIVKRWMREAVREEIAPLTKRVADMEPVVETVAKYIKPLKANGAYVGSD